MDRIIAPGKTDEIEFSAHTPQRPGPLTKQISLTSNDRQNVSVTLVGEADVLAAIRMQPETVNFSQLKRDAPEQKQMVTLTRGDAGPLKPHIASIGHPQIKAELREIEAGEKYELDVTVSPPWPNGVLQGAIMLDTGVEQAPRENVRVFANVTPRLQAVPQRYMLQAEPKADQDLRVRLNWDGEPAKVLDVTTSDPATSVQVTEENKQQIVVLHVPAGYNPQNRMGNSVTVRTDDAVVPVMQIPIMVMNQSVGAAPGQPANAAGRVVPLRSAAQPGGATTRPTAAPIDGTKQPPK